VSARRWQSIDCKQSVEPLHEQLQQQLSVVRADRAFDVEQWVDAKVSLFNDYLRENGLRACVVSVSGGIDSAVTLALAQRALGAADSPLRHVQAIAQPIHSTAAIQQRAYDLGEALGVRVDTVDQTAIFDALEPLVRSALKSLPRSSSASGGSPAERRPEEVEAEEQERMQFAAGQLRSYMRTPVNYYVAQLLTARGLPAVVLGTGNQDEDGYLLYYCKAGDGVCDLQLIADLHKSEVYKVGALLGVPEHILKAKPSADLWPGQEDEKELGFSYDFVELYTEMLHRRIDERAVWLSSLTDDASRQYLRLAHLVRTVHERNRHKLNCPLNLNVERFVLHPKL